MDTLSSQSVRSNSKLRNFAFCRHKIRLVWRGMPARLVLAWILYAWHTKNWIA